MSTLTLAANKAAQAQQTKITKEAEQKAQTENAIRDVNQQRAIAQQNTEPFEKFVEIIAKHGPKKDPAPCSDSREYVLTRSWDINERDKERLLHTLKQYSNPEDIRVAYHNRELAQIPNDKTLLRTGKASAVIYLTERKYVYDDGSGYYGDYLPSTETKYSYPYAMIAYDDGHIVAGKISWRYDEKTHQGAHEFKELYSGTDSLEAMSKIITELGKENYPVEALTNDLIALEASLKKPAAAPAPEASPN